RGPASCCGWAGSRPVAPRWGSIRRLDPEPVRTKVLMQKIIALASLAAVAAVVWWVLSPSSVPPQTAPAAALPEVTVLVHELERRPFADEIQALGTTRAAESVNVTARVTNVVTAVHFTEGELVDAGEVLV